jgi:hypothetical protein
MIQLKIYFLSFFTLLCASQAVSIDISTGFGAFGKDKMEMSGNAATDGYNSQVGIYGGTNVTSEGDIGSNEDIRLTGNVVVNGDANPGPGYQVILEGNAQVTGSTNPTLELVVLDTIESFMPGIENLKISGKEVDTLTEGIYQYKKVEVGGEGNLFLLGNVRIECERFVVSGRGKIYVEGSATILCSKMFEVSGDGIFNAGGEITGETKNTTVFVKNFGSGTEVLISGRGKFFGSLFAPGTVVEISGRGEIFGKVVGKEVKISGNGELHYDEAVDVNLIQQWTFESPVQDFVIGKKLDGEYYVKVAVFYESLPEPSEPFNSIVFYDEAMIEMKRINIFGSCLVNISDDERFIGISELAEVDTINGLDIGRFMMFNIDGDSLWSVSGHKWISGFFYIIDDGNTVLYRTMVPTGWGMITSGGSDTFSLVDFGVGLSSDDSVFVVGYNEHRHGVIKKLDRFGNEIWKTKLSTPGVGGFSLSKDGSWVAVQSADAMFQDATGSKKNHIFFLEGNMGAQTWDFEVPWIGRYQFNYSSDSREVTITRSRNGVWCVDLIGKFVNWTFFDPDTSIWFIKADVNEDGSRVFTGAVTGLDTPYLPWFAYLFDSDGNILWKEELVGPGDTFESEVDPLVKFANPQGSRFFAVNGDRVYYYEAE